MIKLLISLLLFFTTALSATVILTDNTLKYKNFNIQYLYDETSSLTIEDVEKTNFEKTIPNQFTEGYRDANAWFKIELENKSSNEEFILYFTEPFWSNLDLYTKDNGSWTIQKNGLNVALKDRLIQDNNPAYHISIASGKKKTLYVKGRTISGHIGEFQIFNHEEFFRPSRITITESYIIFAFILLGLALLNIYNLIITRETIYAYYIAYVFSFIIFTSMKSASYMSLGFNGWNGGLHVVGAFVTLFLLLFSCRFLELKTNMPKMEKVFKIISVGFLIFALLISQNVPYSSLIFNIYSALFFILLLYTTVKVWYKGFVCARYYLIALIIFAPTMCAMTLTFNTFLDNTDISRYSFLAGAFIEILFFTLLLTHRYLETSAQNMCLTKQTQDLEEIQRRLTIEATTDALSGLYNRRYFTEMSQKNFHIAKRYNTDLSIIVIDIDMFKNINDKYGHAFGDRVIKISADILNDSVRESDIVSRYGGEEFIVLLPETTIEEALLLAERIRVNTEKKDIYSDNGDIFHMTISLGITQLDKENDKNIEQAIGRCDKALYKAKDSGRNMVCSL